MREIGTMVIPENGAEAFELACKKARNGYEVKRSITGYFQLYSDGFLIHDDPACEDVHDEDKAYTKRKNIELWRKNLKNICLVS